MCICGYVVTSTKHEFYAGINVHDLGGMQKKKSFRRVSQRVGLSVEFQKALYKMLDWECCLAGSWVLPLTGMC